MVAVGALLGAPLVVAIPLAGEFVIISGWNLAREDTSDVSRDWVWLF